MGSQSEQTTVDDQVKQLHAELRKINPGRWAVFLGAGASYDYGIPTMKESAAVLREVLAGKKQPGIAIREDARAVLHQLVGNPSNGEPGWDIEQLLTRLYQLQLVTYTESQPFAKTSTSVDGKALTHEAIKVATDELLKYHVEMCQLSSRKLANHDGGSVGYLADFLRLLADYDKTGLRLFTINIDLCVEAAITMLAHRPARDRRPDMTLVDGFGTSVVPVFDLRNFRASVPPELGAYPVYLWKLHGSVDWRFSTCLRTRACPATQDAPSSEEKVIVRRSPDGLVDQLQDCQALQRDASGEEIVVLPTPAKYATTYTFPYIDLFESFRRTIENVDLLLVVGTSFPDQHIRAVVRAFAHRDKTQLFIIDPTMERGTLVKLFDDVPSVQPVVKIGLKDFVQKLGAIAASEPIAQKV